MNFTPDASPTVVIADPGAAQRTSDASPARLTAAGLGLSVTIAPAIAPLAAEWRALEARCSPSLFQSWRWLETWSRTAARHTGERPLFALVSDGGGTVRAALPLAVRSVLGVSVLGWLGQSHASYGMAVMEAEYQKRTTPAEAERLLAMIARSAGAAGLDLTTQPVAWCGQANPFAAISPRPEANDSYILPLEGPPGAVFERRFSARTRSTLRRKERRLGETGRLEIGRANRKGQRFALLEAFFELKARQLADQGTANVFATRALQAFYRALASEEMGPKALLQLSAVSVDGVPAAVLLSARVGAAAYLLNMTVTPGELKAYSPGALLLAREIAEETGVGMRAYDFGPGESPYKREWGSDPVPLVSSRVALGLRALPIIAVQGALGDAKRAIKRSPALWRLAQTARRTLRGRPPSTA
jgi:CelD/BcsL family acetyltransferase involved in cellulose biosynthesis